jgi:hypothetical protein
VPLLHQGFHEEERRRKQPVKNETKALFFTNSVVH